MTSRVSSKNKEKKAKRKNNVKKETKQVKKHGTKKNGKERLRESNPVYPHVQATSCPLHHSDTHDLKINFVIPKQFFSAIDAV